MIKEKYLYWILLPTILVSVFLLHSERKFFIFAKDPANKKKIVVFTSTGGGGHMAATGALQSYLGDEYTLTPYFPLAEHDPMKAFCGFGNGEETYNYLIMRKYYNLMNIIARFGTWFFKVNHDMVTHQFIEYLEKTSPDLVISVMPFVNKALLDATKAKKIPFLLIPTDLDMRTFIKNLGDLEYDKFHLALSFENEDIKEQVKKAHIPLEQTSVCGFPLREDFFSSKNNDAIKKRYNIPTDKPVVLVLMGAAGSYASYRYAKQLTQVELPLHVIVALGRNEILRPKIEDLPLPKTMSLTVLGFTQDMADLMAISDLCITKSGSVSFCEALYSDLPMLIDGTTNTLRWERFNHHYTEENLFGYVIKRYSTVPRLVTQLLYNPHIIADMRKNLQNIAKKEFGSEIKPLVKQLLSKN